MTSGAPATVAVIPARGGSRRIARKNIRDFHGKPLIAYGIEAALSSGCFDRVVISTDSQEIAEVAQAHGAEAPFLRSAALSGDDVPLAPVLLDAIDHLGGGAALESICCIYATAPMIRAEDIVRGRRILRESDADAALSVATFGYPVQRALELGDDGGLRFAHPEFELVRSQDLPELYHDAAHFCWLRASSFVAQRRLVMALTVPVEIPRRLVQDIDTEEDLSVAEALYRSAGT